MVSVTLRPDHRAGHRATCIGEVQEDHMEVSGLLLGQAGMSQASRVHNYTHSQLSAAVVLQAVATRGRQQVVRVCM